MYLEFRDFVKEKDEEIIDRWFDKQAIDFLCFSEDWFFTTFGLKQRLEKQFGKDADIKLYNKVATLNGFPICAFDMAIVNNKRLFVDNIIVNPVRRDKGVASYVLNKIINNPNEIGIDSCFSEIEIHIMKKNEPSLRVAYKNGFYVFENLSGALFLERKINRERQ